MQQAFNLECLFTGNSMRSKQIGHRSSSGLSWPLAISCCRAAEDSASAEPARAAAASDMLRWDTTSVPSASSPDQTSGAASCQVDPPLLAYPAPTVPVFSPGLLLLSASRFSHDTSGLFLFLMSELKPIGDFVEDKAVASSGLSGAPRGFVDKASLSPGPAEERDGGAGGQKSRGGIGPSCSRGGSDEMDAQASGSHGGIEMVQVTSDGVANSAAPSEFWKSPDASPWSAVKTRQSSHEPWTAVRRFNSGVAVDREVHPSECEETGAEEESQGMRTRRTELFTHSRD
ncbi:hypothetical protein THAOC_19917 [Thalassiosira oceanica]|uniref:Uncharacterized protein n=1 Tax=Thalassiosira oceanica TaxID=159749 RepID=K0S3K9_THAOC|nr:hypothetical protein THAOC_19917 [Thalassiosira oceanica]|eukprot:EJK59815.1 hypothetical protein THAOC_19917 [Thalassiosira oceanica]